MKCKIFGPIRPSKLENEINEWLESNPTVEVKFMDAEELRVYILYEE